jgi:hypothetical protein
MERRNDERSITLPIHTQFTATPFGDSPETSERPQGQVAEGKNEIGLDKGDLLHQVVNTLSHMGVDVTLAKGGPVSWVAFLLQANPGCYLVVWRTMLADVCHVALRAKDACLVKHLVKLAATRPYEGMACKLFLSARSLPYNHDAGGDWTLSWNDHCNCSSLLRAIPYATGSSSI